jgi:hypothetical protein
MGPLAPPPPAYPPHFDALTPTPVPPLRLSKADDPASIQEEGAKPSFAGAQIGLLLIVTLVILAGVGYGIARTVSSSPSHSLTLPSSDTSGAHKTPGGSVPDTQESQTPTTAASTALAGVPACLNRQPSPEIRPTTIDIACATGDYSVTGVTWQSWGPDAAYGQGMLNVNSCIPYCTQGTFYSYPASVEVSNPSTSSSGPMFQDVTVTPVGNQVVNSSSPGAWGAP